MASCAEHLPYITWVHQILSLIHKHGAQDLIPEIVDFFDAGAINGAKRDPDQRRKLLKAYKWKAVRPILEASDELAYTKSASVVILPFNLPFSAFVPKPLKIDAALLL
eukprot:7856242-Karenia_brevis.AAC.1